MTKDSKAHIALFVAQVIYALNYSIAKDLMPDHLKPLTLVLLRITGACILFWLLSFFTKNEKVEKSDLKKLMLLALFGVVLNQLFFIFGLSITYPINSAIIMISNPIVVIAFTIIVLKERFTIYKFTGLLLGVLGALTLLLFKGNFVLGSNTLLGDLFTLINSISWAVFVVMAKPYMQKYQTVTVMKWIFLFGFIMFSPFAISDFLDTNWLSFNTSVWGAIAFVVIATTFFAYLLNTIGLKELSPSVVSMYIYFQPFLATFFAILLGKDEITPIKIISAVFIITGVYIVNKKVKA
jgi:drug/metabolite transporter (DMT)-like permease